MAAAAAAVSEGWRVVYLGANLPGRDIARAAEQVGARVVALSVVYPDDGATASEIVDAARALPPGAELVIGGAGASVIEHVVLPEGVRVLGDIGALRRMLRGAVSSVDHVVGDVAG